MNGAAKRSRAGGRGAGRRPRGAIPMRGAAFGGKTTHKIAPA